MSWSIWSNSLAAGSGAVGPDESVGEAAEDELLGLPPSPVPSEPDGPTVSNAASEACGPAGAVVA
jgi:hypothetical protein